MTDQPSLFHGVIRPDAYRCRDQLQLFQMAGSRHESAHAVAAPLDPLLRIKAMRGNSIVATNRQRSDLSVALGLREGGRRWLGGRAPLQLEYVDDRV